jgi:DNA-binding response OmpR family regulator
MENLVVPDVKVPNLSLPKEALVRVLVIDDEEPFRNSIKGLFEDWGYKVDTAETPDEAIQLLKSKSYEIIIADITFDLPQMSGDQLITDHHELMSPARIIAITGQGKDRIKRIKELEKFGVVILEKGGETGTLKDLVTEKLEERKRQMAFSVQESLTFTIAEAIRHTQRAVIEGGEVIAAKPTPPQAFIGSEYLLREINQTLVDWLKSREDPNRRSILYGTRVFSTNDLAMEIEQGTDVGMEHLEMMVDLFKECLKLK